MASPADVASNQLPSTVVGGASGWVRMVGFMPSDPDQVVCFYDTPGRNPNPRWLIDYPSFQAKVRGKPNEYGVAWTKAKEVKDVLLGIASQDIGSDRWVSVTGQGEIMFLEYDDKMRPVFSVNFNAIIQPADNALTNREPIP